MPNSNFFPLVLRLFLYSGFQGENYKYYRILKKSDNSGINVKLQVTISEKSSFNAYGWPHSFSVQSYLMFLIVIFLMT